MRKGIIILILVCTGVCQGAAMEISSQGLWHMYIVYDGLQQGRLTITEMAHDDLRYELRDPFGKSSSVTVPIGKAITEHRKRIADVLSGLKLPGQDLANGGRRVTMGLISAGTQFGVDIIPNMTGTPPLFVSTANEITLKYMPVEFKALSKDITLLK